MTNEQLVALIQAEENVGENMAQLYTQVKAFIHSIAWKYRTSGELEDLEQEGYLALYPAIDGYDPAAGCKFLTYAEKWIRQRMQRYLQINGKCLRLPVHCLEKVHKYKQFFSDYQREHGSRPSDLQAAAHLGLSLDEIENIRKNACMANLGSLDSPVKGLDGGEDTTVGDLIACAVDMEEEVVEQLQQEQLCKVLWKCMDELPGQQAAVIHQRYQEGLTMAEIGRRRGTTQEVARQIHAKALRGLRSSKYARQLRPFMIEEYIYSAALQSNGLDKFNQTWTSSTERIALRLSDGI